MSWFKTLKQTDIPNNEKQYCLYNLRAKGVQHFFLQKLTLTLTLKLRVYTIKYLSYNLQISINF